METGSLPEFFGGEKKKRIKKEVGRKWLYTCTNGSTFFF